MLFSNGVLVILLSIYESAVARRPYIRDGPEDVTLNLQQGSIGSVNLRCRINYQHSYYKVSWKKNNVVISTNGGINKYTQEYTDERYAILHSQNDAKYDLKIDPVSKTTAHNDQGEYQCVLIYKAYNYIVSSSRNLSNCNN